MSDNDSPSPFSSAASSSASRSALDSSSAQALTRAMEGVRHALEDIKATLGSQERMGRFREQAQQNAIEKMTAAVAQLAQSVDKAVRLNREVARDGQQRLEAAARSVKEATGQHALLPRESEEEITQRVLKRWALRTLLPWMGRHAAPLILGALAAAAAAALAYVKAKFH